LKARGGQQLLPISRFLPAYRRASRQRQQRGGDDRHGAADTPGIHGLGHRHG
jgi:hypothetical protein